MIGEHEHEWTNDDEWARPARRVCKWCRHPEPVDVVRARPQPDRDGPLRLAGCVVVLFVLTVTVGLLWLVTARG